MIKLPPQWDADAACQGHFDEMFPQGVGNARLRAERKAIRMYCNSCPIKQLCAEHAQEFGIWGGRTEAERKSDSAFLSMFR